MSVNKWIKLNSKKEPEFGVLCAIWIKPEKEDEGWEECWVKAKLRDINNRDGKKKFIFVSDDDKIEWHNATHFMEIQPPQE